MRFAGRKPILIDSTQLLLLLHFELYTLYCTPVRTHGLLMKREPVITA
jgi:hypothetical protein